jgi:hypothetical protein
MIQSNTFPRSNVLVDRAVITLSVLGMMGAVLWSVYKGWLDWHLLVALTYLVSLLIFIKFWLKLHQSKYEHPTREVLYAGINSRRSLCSNVSSFLSIGVIAMFLVAPANVLMVRLVEGAEFSEVSRLSWELWLWAMGPLVGLILVRHFGRRIERECPDLDALQKSYQQNYKVEQTPTTYLSHIARIFPGKVALPTVLFLIFLYMLLTILGEVLIFTIVCDELFASSPLWISRLIVGTCVGVSIYYVTRHWYKSVLGTDIFQFFCIIGVFVVVLTCIVPSAQLSGISLQQSTILSPSETHRGYRADIEKEIKAVRSYIPYAEVHGVGFKFLHVLAVVGVFITIVSWMAVAPNSWVINVSSWYRQKACKRGPPVWAVLTAGVVLGVICLSISKIGLLTSQTTFRHLSCYSPKLDALWQHEGTGRTWHIARAMAMLAYGDNWVIWLVSIFLGLGMLSCFQTTFDTSIITVAQLADETSTITHCCPRTRDRAIKFLFSFVFPLSTLLVLVPVTLKKLLLDVVVGFFSLSQFRFCRVKSERHWLRMPGPC